MNWSLLALGGASGWHSCVACGLHYFSDARPLTPDVHHRIRTVDLDVLVPAAEDGRVPDVWRAVRRGGVNDLVVGNDDVSRLAGGLYGVVWQLHCVDAFG